jgi:MFS family permease
MTGVVVSGLSIGRMVAPPVTSQLISAYGWRFSYIILGGTILLATFIASQFLRRDPAQMGLQPYGVGEGKQEGMKSDIKGFSLREVIYTLQFWLVFTIFFCFGFSSFSVWVHIVPHATELNISAIKAAGIISISSGASILGNFVLGGVIGDRVGNRKIIVTGFILMSAVLFWLLFARELWMLYLFAAVSGLAIGGLAASEPPLLARLFGLSSHGLILGIVGLGFTFGAAIGPFVTGYIFDFTDSYRAAFLICAAVAVFGFILASILRPVKTLEVKL